MICLTILSHVCLDLMDSLYTYRDRTELHLPEASQVKVNTIK